MRALSPHFFQGHHNMKTAILMLLASPAYAQVTPILIDPIPLPEPGTWALLLIGAVSLYLVRFANRRRGK